MTFYSFRMGEDIVLTAPLQERSDIGEIVFNRDFGSLLIREKFGKCRFNNRLIIRQDYTGHIYIQYN